MLFKCVFRLCRIWLRLVSVSFLWTLQCAQYLIKIFLVPLTFCYPKYVCGLHVLHKSLLGFNVIFKLINFSKSFLWRSPGLAVELSQVDRLGSPERPEPADWRDWKSVINRFDPVCNPEVVPFWILWTLLISSRFLCLDGWSGFEKTILKASDGSLVESKLATDSFGPCSCSSLMMGSMLGNRVPFVLYGGVAPRVTQPENFFSERWLVDFFCVGGFAATSQKFKSHGSYIEVVCIQDWQNFWDTTDFEKPCLQKVDLIHGLGFSDNELKKPKHFRVCWLVDWRRDQ